jgi:transposase-like protein
MIDLILNPASSTRIWRRPTAQPSQTERRKGRSAAGVATDPVQYLNTIIEQDHRAIKRQVKAKQGFREFQATRRTIQGYEAMSIIRKSQVRWLSGNDVRRQNRFINELFEVAA